MLAKSGMERDEARVAQEEEEIQYRYYGVVV